jgi:hypothetical protein
MLIAAHLLHAFLMLVIVPAPPNAALFYFTRICHFLRLSSHAFTPAAMDMSTAMNCK